jgi:hypothetical protein
VEVGVQIWSPSPASKLQKSEEDGEVREVEKQGTCILCLPLPSRFGIPAHSAASERVVALAAAGRQACLISSWSQLMHVPSFSIVHASPGHLEPVLARER